jgi:tetratricopeptide (TPR) repeat protein
VERLGPSLWPRGDRDDRVLAYKARSNQLLKIGAYEEARIASEEALSLLTQMAEEGRDDLREDLAKLWGTKAITLKKLGDVQAAIASFAESAKIFKVASSRYHQPEFADAADFMETEADKLRPLVSFREEDAAQLFGRPEHAIQAGTQMSLAGDPFHACELIDDAILIYSVMSKQRPSQGRVQALADTQMKMAVMALYSRRDFAAERAFRAAIDGYERLITEFHQTNQLEGWGRASLGLAMFLKSVRRFEESRIVVDSAGERMRSLGKDRYKQWQRSADELLGGM